MPLIELRAVEKDWGLDPLFSELNLKIEEGEKIGLVGPNGSGKTSLLRILAGLDEDHRGSVLRRSGLRVALVPQRYEPPEGLSCVELLTEGAASAKAKLEGIALALAAAGEGESDYRGLLDEYGRLCSLYDELGGEGAEEGARRLLDRSGLGAVADTSASALSGGEKSVLALALGLAGAPDLLLLDEPGNHLDFAGLAWLESFIRGERRAVLMVSHNRSLLDRCVGRTLELEDGSLSSYAGGYSAYRVEKLGRRAGQGKDWQADRKRLERLEALVRRFAEIAAGRPDPAWGKRLRARRSQLEREREAATERPSGDGRRMSVDFSASILPRSDYALSVKDYSKAFGERRLFEAAGFDLLVGEKAAIIGPNGSGKTSFLRDLVCRSLADEAGRWDSGESIRVGPSMKLGYCAQEQEVFRRERTVGEEFASLGAREDETYRLLRRYSFDRAALEARVDSLSGGELGRLQIARAVYLGANFLVLDEPTNHLDIESREALEEALEGYEGTILFVSHDSWFLEKIASRLILVEDMAFVPYEGSFAEYWRDLGAARGGGRTRPARAGLEERSRSLSRAASGGGLAGPSRRATLEDRITSLEKEKEALERASAAASEARDFARAGRAADKAGELSRRLERLYAEWEGSA
jgi:ATP-binding cassette, subfamily F, member 3